VSAGVEFFKTLPSLEDPFALRSTVADLPTAQSADTWLTSLQQQVALQAKAVAANPSLGGFLAAFTAPMVITGAARIYSIYTSEQVFNGQVVVKISTDGKLLIIGKLNFAANNVSLSGRLYVDLSKVAQGDATVLFLADIPDQVRLLTLYGKLKMGFRDSSGREVTFDVLDAPDPTATGTAPTVDVGGPVAGGGSADVSVVNGPAGAKYVDVVFLAPSGATLDLADILDPGQEFTIGYRRSDGSIEPLTVNGRPTPLVAVTTSDGLRFVEVRYATSSSDRKLWRAYYEYNDTVGSPLTTVDIVTGAQVDQAALLATATGEEYFRLQALRIAGITRFRYTVTGGLAGEEWKIGTVRISFAAGAIRNSDVTVNGVTTQGARSAARDIDFRVTGVTATVTNPGAGIDINVVNNRGWKTFLDVTFTAASGQIVLASLLDLAPEFVLGGSGLGTAVLDATRAPTLLGTATASATSYTLRFWVTGAFAETGTVTVTPVVGAWSFVSDATAELPPAGTPTPTWQVGVATGQLQLRLAGARTAAGGWQLSSGLILDPASFTVADLVDVDAATAGVQLYSSGAVRVSVDPNVAFTYAGDGVFVVTVVVTGLTGTTTVAVTPTVVANAVSGTSTDPDAYAAGRLAVAPFPVTGASATPTSYLDITFSPSLGALLQTGSIDGNEFVLTGAGVGSVQLTGSPFLLDGTTYRYLLAGRFSVGPVSVVFSLANFTDNSGRSPPAGSTSTSSFIVVGATADATSSDKALNGQVVGVDVVNGRRYLEITFRPASGSSLDHTTINGDEIVFATAGGTVITLGSPVRVGTSDTYRYSFTASLAVGGYTLTFVSGSFADIAGTRNAEEVEAFTLAAPTVTITNPNNGAAGDAKDFSRRGYLDITFPTLGGVGVDPASILDAGAEFTVEAVNAILTISGAPTFLSGSTYRYWFTYTLTNETDPVTGQPASIGGFSNWQFVAGSWASTSGALWTTADGAPTERTATAGVVWFDVRYRGIGDLDLEELLAGGQLSLAGAGSEALTAGDVVQLDDTTFRYLYTGVLTPGTLTLTIAAGSWSDAAGNTGGGTTSTFRLITRGTSFYIELLGGIILATAGLTDEPLLDLRARVVLEIDPARKLFALSFDGQLSIIYLGTVGSTSGKFVLDLGDESTSVPQFWGVATLETNFSALEPYGIKMFAKGTLQINLTGEEKVETITLLGIGDGGGDVTRSFVLRPYSFGLELVGQLIVEAGGSELMRLQGGIWLSIEGTPTPSMQLYLTGELSFGAGSARLTYGAATGVLFIRTGGGFGVGVAGMFTISQSASIGLPSSPDFLISGKVSVMFNTTGHRQEFQVPASFLPLLHEGDPTTLVVYAAAPGLNGAERTGVPAEIYAVATIQATLIIKSVITLVGYIQIAAAVDTGGGVFRIQVTGAVGGTIPFLGSVTGEVYLQALIGTRNGLVGRIRLTIGSNTIPGVRLNGQFVLEVNTVVGAGGSIGPETIQTFVLEGEGSSRHFATVPGHPDQFQVADQEVGFGIRLQMFGELVLLDRLRIAALVDFEISPTRFRLNVVGTMTLEPLGHVNVSLMMQVDARGLVAYVGLDLSLGMDFSGIRGLSFGSSLSAYVFINTTSADVAYDHDLNSGTAPVTITRGFRLHLEGSINLLLVEASGSLDIT
ncbi:MAG: hypothetical protein AAGC63_08475, partial [Propionicimonas sp.]